jgi:PAS domain S-box-containing protein
MTSPERIIVLVNPAANALFGYAPDELIGRPASILEAEGTEPEHAPGSEAREVSYRHRSGELILTSTPSSVVRSADGEVFGYVAIVRDIREQRREEEMRQFISDAGDVLASSLDPRETLSALARLAVPTLGDWCLIDLPEDDGSVRRAEVVIADPRHEPVKAKVARFAIASRRQRMCWQPYGNSLSRSGGTRRRSTRVWRSQSKRVPRGKGLRALPGTASAQASREDPLA